jgi:hypothetical protein
MWGEGDFYSRIFTKAAFKRFAVQVSVTYMHTKGWWSWASHVTERAFVMVHMVTHVVPQQSLRRVILGAVWTLKTLHCNSSDQYTLDKVAHATTHNSELSKHTSTPKHDLKIQLSLSSVCMCVYNKVYNSHSKGTWRLQWSKNLVLVAKSPPHVGQPTSFSCVWLLTWSPSLYIDRNTDLQPAAWKDLHFNIGNNLSAHPLSSI